MKIAILANDGSPLGVTMKSVYGDDGRVGIGGAELALLTNCETFHNAGYEVVLFNDPTDKYGSPFEQRGKDDFCPDEDWDAVIAFRSPNSRIHSFRGFKVWWSTDQYTIGKFDEFAPTVNKIVTISPFHADYFRKEYGIRNTITIDLPVRIDDYKQEVEKVRGRCIFTSVPDRGLQILHAAWPLIKRDFPDSSLVITSDYRLWGYIENNAQHRLSWLHHRGVDFLGAVPRRRLVEEQLKAQVHTYPVTYNELFCIAVAESQVAGVWPVTASTGAVRTTNMGTVLEGNYQKPEWIEAFVSHVVSLLNNPELPDLQKDLQQKAIERFHPMNILDQWETKVFNNG